MSNFNYRSQFNYSFAAKAVALRASIAFDSSGDASIISGTGMGIASISHDGTGIYTINLGRKFHSLMMIKHVFNSGSAAPDAPELYISSDDVQSAGTVEITLAAAGVAADPADGEIMLIEILVNDSSLAY